MPKFSEPILIDTTGNYPERDGTVSKETMEVLIDEETGNVYVSTPDFGGYDCAWMDTKPLIEWIKANKPELLK